MVWQEVGEPTKAERASLRGQRKLKLYADEDVEAAAVRALRRHGVNIHSAQESGLTGRPDEFHAAHALKLKRVLLTKNAKHFLDDRKIPFQKTYGVIAIACDVRNEAEYTTVLGHVLNVFVEYGDTWQGQKILVTPTEITVRARDVGGIVTKRFRADGDRILYREDGPGRAAPTP